MKSRAPLAPLQAKSSGPRGIKGTGTHAPGLAFLSSQSGRWFTSPTPPHFEMKRNPRAKYQLGKARARFSGPIQLVIDQMKHE